MAEVPIANNLIIELHVPEFAPVKDFYSKLGFEIISEDVKGEYPGYMVMQRGDPLGDTMINFYGDDERVYDQSYFKQFDKNTPRGYAISLTIPVQEIHAFYEEVLKDLKDNVVQELKEKGDGKRTWKDFRMSDPYGYYIRFTELLDWGQK
ncbi:MAG: hypothetical protein NUV80_03310 [Candidatus Berkelbacteria bacterium]|nr:hypothetical protein [Candidatus Berkelbacteria bacterium]MCR4307563.1 hypothetical protein [Candidatus Berkelbacteria bacterium]